MSDPAASPLFDYSRAFGVALHALLDTHGVTAVQLSEALGVVPETTTGWLGGAHLPGAAELPRIGATLALTVDEQADLQTAYSIAWLARRDPQNAHRLAAAPNNEARHAVGRLDAFRSGLAEHRKDIVDAAGIASFLLAVLATPPALESYGQHLAQSDGAKSASASASAEPAGVSREHARLATVPELGAFISTERMRFAGEHNNMLAFSFAAINRYYFFLRSIYQRHCEASKAYVDNTTAFRATMLPGTHELNAEQLQLSEEGRILSLTVQMELETFYVFAKMLLDKVAQAIGFYFGAARGCSTSSHDDLTKSIRTYAERKGLVLPESLVEEMEHLRTDVADFRDKQISHEKSPRTTRPMLIEGDGTVRMALTRIYPKEGEQQVESRSVAELLSEVEEYVRHVVQFVEENRDRTALTLVETR